MSSNADQFNLVLIIYAFSDGRFMLAKMEAK